MIAVLTDPHHVFAFVPTVSLVADSATKFLGFFPRSVYSDFCRKGQLFVAVKKTSSTDSQYMGHLLFDFRFPRAYIRQIYVTEGYRHQKVAKKLVDALKAILTEGQFISVHARVAEDLRDANDFWESQGFYAQRVEVGGISRRRMIVVRAHELKTPQLFAPSGISALDPFGLDTLEGSDRPLYLLDLNVLFDLGPRRFRHQQALSVFKAERLQACALAISSEIEAELKRTTREGKTDPMLAFASTLATFSVPLRGEQQSLLEQLAISIFPDRASSGTLSVNDQSDLMHLATAIHHGLSGFITSDAAILDAAPILRRKFNVDVISPELFVVAPSGSLESIAHEVQGAATIEVLTASTTHMDAIRQLLSSLLISTASQAQQWAASDMLNTACVRRVALIDGVVAGYLVLPANILNYEIRAYIAVDEQQKHVCELVQSLLRQISGQIKTGEVRHIKLVFPPRQASIREVAATFGYVGTTAEGGNLQKIAVKQCITDGAWERTRDLLWHSTKLDIGSEVMTFRHVDQQVPLTRPDGQKVLVSLFKLESLLAPVLFCLTGREGVMVPIRKHFVEQLLVDSPQQSLLPKGKAELTPSRHYFSDKKTLKNFKRGDLLFFYESSKHKGAGAVIAVGRVLRAYVREETAMLESDFGPSVLDSERLFSIGVSKVKTITVFDNVQRLVRPFPLSELRELGCGEPHQLLTSQRLSSVQVQAILSKGF